MLRLLRREEEGNEISPLWAWEGSAPAPTFAGSRLLCHPSFLPPWPGSSVLLVISSRRALI